MNLVIKDVVLNHFTKRLNNSLPLAKMWSFIVNTNPGASNPYHNTQHMKHMAGIAVFLLENSDEYKAMSKADQHLYSTLLLIACCWHDYGHSAGRYPDDVNIHNAGEAFVAWFNTEWDEMLTYATGTTYYIDTPAGMAEAVKYSRLILEILKVTEFPFVYNPTTILQKCARDADLLYTFDHNTGQIVHGLYLELKSSGKFPFSFMSFMHRQAEFLDSCEHFTPLGKQIHAAMKDEVLAEQFAWAESQGFA